jgi:hypothetical protein
MLEFFLFPESAHQTLLLFFSGARLNVDCNCPPRSRAAEKPGNAILLEHHHFSIRFAQFAAKSKAEIFQ